MKRMITIATSAALLLSVAVPTWAMINPAAVAGRMSHRLLEAKTLAEQRVPVGEVETTLLLRERKEAMPDASGFSNLQRSRILTRIHTLRGVRMTNTQGERPSRRSIIDNAESMLVLPSLLVQTGGTETAATQKITRRTLIRMTEQANDLSQ